MKLNKSVGMVVAGAMVCTGLSVVVADPASAHSPHCATKHGYHKVHHGQTMRQIARELRSNGHKESSASSSGYRAEIRTYKTCSPYSSIAVSFSANPHRRLREDAKDAVWVN